MGVPEDMPETAGKAGEGKAENAGNSGHLSVTVAEGARGPICINRGQPPESHPCVIWVTYAFGLGESG
ncbi:hypothetical protein GCM10010433_18370 [Streptomyces pulveraceus]